MRKLCLLAATLAVVVIAAAPAIAGENLPAGPESTVIDAPPSEGPIGPPDEGPAGPLSDSISCSVLNAAPAADPSCGGGGSAPPEDTILPPPGLGNAVESPATDAYTGPIAPPVADGLEIQDNDIDDDSAEEAGDDAVQDSGDDSAEDTSDDAFEDSALDAGDQESDSVDEKTSGDDEDDDDDSRKDDDNDEEDNGDDKEDDDEIEQDSDQDADSGDADQDIDIINTGDNVNLCIGIIQAVNTGNIQDSDQIAQEDSEAEEVELEDGSTISVTPQLIVDCRQIIYQIVTGEDSDGSKDKVSKTGASKLAKTKIDLKSTYFRNSAGSGGAQQVRTGGTGTRVISNRSDARAARQANASRRALPRTGGMPVGYAAILGLSVGAPLVGGGLLLRRISR